MQNCVNILLNPQNKGQTVGEMGRSKEGGVRREEERVKSKESGVRSKEGGVRREESGVRGEEKPENGFVDGVTLHALLLPSHFLLLTPLFR